MKLLDVPKSTSELAKRRTDDIVRAYSKMGRDDLEYLAMSAYVQGLNDALDNAELAKEAGNV